ncbi:unnamed protein product, partial [Tetraodon nigroviridis]
YQWLKEKIVSEDGKKQQAKLKELNHITEKLGCTLPQLAVGKTSMAVLGPVPRPSSLVPVAWCLRNEGVSSVLLGTSNPEQLTENLGAIQVRTPTCSCLCCCVLTCVVLLVQVLPKMTSHVVSEIDHILGNRPYSKKDFRS